MLLRMVFVRRVHRVATQAEVVHRAMANAVVGARVGLVVQMLVVSPTRFKAVSRAEMVPPAPKVVFARMATVLTHPGMGEAGLRSRTP